jgi:hypothetical protein
MWEIPVHTANAEGANSQCSAHSAKIHSYSTPHEVQHIAVIVTSRYVAKTRLQRAN